MAKNTSYFEELCIKQQELISLLILSKGEINSEKLDRRFVALFKSLEFTKKQVSNNSKRITKLERELGQMQEEEMMSQIPDEVFSPEKNTEKCVSISPSSFITPVAPDPEGDDSQPLPDNLI